MFVLQFPGLNLISTSAASSLSYFFMLLASYGLALGFSDVATMKTTCALSFGQACTPIAAYAWDAAGAKITFRFASIPVWFGVIMTLEYYALPRAGARVSWSEYVRPSGEAIEVCVCVCAARAHKSDQNLICSCTVS
jgi:hypothetical protein